MLKCLNLYSGIGGNRKLWENVEVTAIELNHELAEIYKDFYPNDTMIVTDAHEYLLNNYNEFDFIWGSPPCQTHSIMRWKMANSNMIKKSKKNLQPQYADMKLYQEIILLSKYKFKGKWVFENVKPYYEPLIKPTAILGRHLFWSNFNIQIRKYPAERINESRIYEMAKIKGIDISGLKIKNKLQVVRNCVNSEIGLHILNCARNITTLQNESQIILQL